jgi:hypothetical protein
MASIAMLVVGSVAAWDENCMVTVSVAQFDGVLTPIIFCHGSHRSGVAAGKKLKM